MPQILIQLHIQHEVMRHLAQWWGHHLEHSHPLPEDPSLNIDSPSKPTSCCCALWESANDGTNAWVLATVWETREKFWVLDSAWRRPRLCRNWASEPVDHPLVNALSRSLTLSLDLSSFFSSPCPFLSPSPAPFPSSKYIFSLKDLQLWAMLLLTFSINCLLFFSFWGPFDYSVHFILPVDLRISLSETPPENISFITRIKFIPLTTIYPKGSTMQTPENR